MDRKRNWVGKFLIAAGVLNIVYFIGARAFHVNFANFFALLGCIFIVSGFLKLLNPMQKNRDKFRKVVIVIRCSALLIIASFILIEIMIISGGIKKEEGNGEYVVILGAGLYGDNPSMVLRYRLEKGIEYLKKYPDTKVIVSGGKGEGETISEAEAMERYLIKAGIKKDHIIKEDQSRTTKENLIFTRKIIEKQSENENPSIILITNNFHMFRAEYLAKRIGINAYTYPAEIHPMLIPAYYVREYFAVIKAFFT